MPLKTMSKFRLNHDNIFFSPNVHLILDSDQFNVPKYKYTQINPWVFRWQTLWSTGVDALVAVFGYGAATLSLMNSVKRDRRGHGAERIGAIFVDCGANAKRPKSCLIGSFPPGTNKVFPPLHPENLHSAVLHAEVEPPQAGFTDWVTIVRRSLPSNSLVAARTSVVLPSSGIGRRPGRFLRLPRHAVDRRIM